MPQAYTLPFDLAGLAKLELIVTNFHKNEFNLSKIVGLKIKEIRAIRKFLKMTNNK